MYQSFYGLRELPFELTPNSEFLFLPPGHLEAFSNLEYGLSSAKSLTLLLGEAGTGKTTLLRAALESERCRNVRCVYMNNPTLTMDDFVRTLAAGFELGPAVGESKAFFIESLVRMLRERRSRGEITALIVDEAQSLSNALLEEIRLLTNIESTLEKLLPLVLAGQPELGNRLEDPALRQLKQRVTLRCELAPFELNHTAAYITSRITTAGGVAPWLFTLEAVKVIHEYSGGILRTINVICDNALLTGLALGRQPVDQAIVREVCSDLRLRPAKVGVPLAAKTNGNGNAANKNGGSGVDSVAPPPPEASAHPEAPSRFLRLFASGRP
jgi:general secretion pathway protein A